jgi:flagellar biosynthesis protein FlhG
MSEMDKFVSKEATPLAKRNNLRVICLAGGKGGIGKTTIAINTAIALAKRGNKVALFDADLGLANIDVLLGQKVTRNISHVLNGQCSLEDICITGPHGIKIIPAASGIQRMAELTSAESAGLIHAFSDVLEGMDMLLIDTAAGISNQVLQFAQASHDIIMVVRKGPASITDAYAQIKLLNTKHAVNNFWVLSNMVNSVDEGEQLYLRLLRTANKFLDVNLQYLGHIPQDDYIPLAAEARRPILDEFPEAPAAKLFYKICDKIMAGEMRQTHSNVTFGLERMLTPA